MRIGIQALIALLAFGLASASAETYSGKWSATGGASGRCIAGFVMNITVEGNNFSAEAGGGLNSFTLHGTIAPDGSFTAQGNEGSVAKGRFVSDTVEVTFGVSCGWRTGTGRRTS